MNWTSEKISTKGMTYMYVHIGINLSIDIGFWFSFPPGFLPLFLFSAPLKNLSSVSLPMSILPPSPHPLFNFVVGNALKRSYPANDAVNETCCDHRLKLNGGGGGDGIEII